MFDFCMFFQKYIIPQIGTILRVRISFSSKLYQKMSLENQTEGPLVDYNEEEDIVTTTDAFQGDENVDAVKFEMHYFR